MKDPKKKAKRIISHARDIRNRYTDLLSGAEKSLEKCKDQPISKALKTDILYYKEIINTAKDIEAKAEALIQLLPSPIYSRKQLDAAIATAIDQAAAREE